MSTDEPTLPLLGTSELTTGGGVELGEGDGEIVGDEYGEMLGDGWGDAEHVQVGLGTGKEFESEVVLDTEHPTMNAVTTNPHKSRIKNDTKYFFFKTLPSQFFYYRMYGNVLLFFGAESFSQNIKRMLNIRVSKKDFSRLSAVF